jgi:O-acetyl-ADP-ribose deacetylase (regulator of RNase III)
VRILPSRSLGDRVVQDKSFVGIIERKMTNCCAPQWPPQRLCLNLRPLSRACKRKLEVMSQQTKLSAFFSRAVQKRPLDVHPVLQVVQKLQRSMTMQSDASSKSRLKSSFDMPKSSAVKSPELSRPVAFSSKIAGPLKSSISTRSKTSSVENDAGDDDDTIDDHKSETDSRSSSQRTRPLTRAATMAGAVTVRSMSTSTSQKREESKNDDTSASKLICERPLSATTVVQVRLGDISREDVDAIVNAANGELQHGSGVAGALRRAAGSRWQAESAAYVRKHGSIDVGQVAITGPGELNAKYVIHAVGPIWRDGTRSEAQLLHSAVRNSLNAAHELKCESISLPAISSGIFGFDKAHCAKIMFT